MSSTNDGNLSKRKGLLSDLKDSDLTRIAEMIYTWAGYDKDALELKEDVSNKIMALGEIAEESQYFSAEATKKYVKEIDDATRAELGQAITDLGDRKATWGTTLSDYRIKDAYTKEEINTVTSEIKETAETALTIAKGRATGYVFDTVEDLDIWLSDETNTSGLILGDNFYIKAVDVPDYWWDGAEKQQLETQKVDLKQYFTKEEMIEIIEVINNELNEREFTSNRVTVIDEMSIMQGPTYPTANAVFNFVNGKIGDIETSLENIITKYGLGGDAS